MIEELIYFFGKELSYASVAFSKRKYLIISIYIGFVLSFVTVLTSLSFFRNAIPFYLYLIGGVVSVGLLILFFYVATKETKRNLNVASIFALNKMSSYNKIAFKRLEEFLNKEGFKGVRTQLIIDKLGEKREKEKKPYTATLVAFLGLSGTVWINFVVAIFQLKENENIYNLFISFLLFIAAIVFIVIFYALFRFIAKTLISRYSRIDKLIELVEDYELTRE